MAGWMVLLAEDGLSGVAGWVAAGSSVGLLGPVLYWLCYVHLPAERKDFLDLVRQKDKDVREVAEGKDKQLMDLTEAKDNQIIDLISKQEAEREKDRGLRHDQVNKFQLTISELYKESERRDKETRTEFQGALKSIMEHCERETGKMTEAIVSHLKPIIQSKGTT